MASFETFFSFTFFQLRYFVIENCSSRVQGIEYLGSKSSVCLGKGFFGSTDRLVEMFQSILREVFLTLKSTKKQGILK